MEPSADPKEGTRQEPTKQELSPPAARDAVRPEQIAQGPHAHPLVDVLTRPDEIVLRADMPGVAPDAIDVRFENGILILAGRVRRDAGESRSELFREFAPRNFYREFTVGEGVDRERITAEVDSGVLTLRLPKAEASKPRRIEVRKRSPDRESEA